MTMRLNDGFAPVLPEIDHAKKYAYTWPGKPEAVVTGAELASLLKGADASQLAIREVVDAPAAPSRAPTRAAVVKGDAT